MLLIKSYWTNLFSMLVKSQRAHPTLRGHFAPAYLVGGKKLNRAYLFFIYGIYKFASTIWMCHFNNFLPSLLRLMKVFVVKVGNLEFNKVHMLIFFADIFMDDKVTKVPFMNFYRLTSISKCILINFKLILQLLGTKENLI